MSFTDIHIHALYGVDDGAKTEEQMQRMITASYKDGVRVMCFTPHFHPAFFGDNKEDTIRAFREAKAFAEHFYPNMRLLLGNELRYSKESINWITDGECCTLNGTEAVLTDFIYSESAGNIVSAMNRILNAGYRPVLAHVERYINLKTDTVRELAQNGVWIQVNAASVTGANGFKMKHRANTLIKEQLVDFIASDAHNMDKRPPMISTAYKCIVKKFGKAAADALCCNNALQMLNLFAEEGTEVIHE